MQIYEIVQKLSKSTIGKTIVPYTDTTPGTINLQQVDDNRCFFCGKKFKALHGLSQHENKCSVKKIQALEENNKIQKQQIDMLLEDKKNLTELSIQNAKNNSKAMSALGYIISNFPNGEPLQQISTEKMDQIIYAKKEENTPIERSFILYYKAKSLHKHIGDAIIDVYKCDDPSEQSFHTTDCSRMNYIVMAAIGNNKEWTME